MDSNAEDNNSFFDEHAAVLFVDEEYEQLLGRIDRDKYNCAAQRELVRFLSSERAARTTAIVYGWRHEASTLPDEAAA